MFKLSEEYQKLLTEKKIKYDMINVNGGFSDGVEVDIYRNVGAMNVSVNIYGGGTLHSLKYHVPDRIKEYQDAMVAARQTGDPVGTEFSGEVEKYQSMIKKAVGLAMVSLIEKFDQDAKLAISAAISRVNKVYKAGDAPPVESEPVKPAPTSTNVPKPAAPKAAPKPAPTTPRTTAQVKPVQQPINRK